MEVLLIIIVLVVLGGGVFVISQYFKMWRNRRYDEWLSSQKSTMIRIDVPRNNDKAPLAAEQMFASMHGIYSDSAMYQNHISFEIVSRDKYIQFYVHMPVHLRDFIEGQIYAQYPTVEIHDVDDYTTSVDLGSMQFAGTELLTTKEDVYPIKLFNDFEVDPISGITSVMAKLKSDEQVWLQFNIRPVGDEWQDKGNNLINSIKTGKSSGAKGTLKSIWSVIFKGIKMVFLQAVSPGAEVAESSSEPPKLAGTVEEALKGIEFKIMKLGYETKIRILAVSKDGESAKNKAQGIAAAFKQYNTTNANGFKSSNISINDKSFFNDYKEREFSVGGNIFNISELASLYHFPHETVSTPNIVWSGAKKGEPPANLPLQDNTPKDDFTTIGETTFRNVFKLFGIKRDDRRRHVYIIGKSGVGKSVLMENMAIHDIHQGEGVIIVDPHGEFAEKVLACIPKERENDVIVFDPADRSYPIAFNLLENVDDDFKGMVASGFVGIFKKIFGHSWGPRLEHILRNTVLALLDYENSTMLDIPRMLTEEHFREKVVKQVKDTVIREFWMGEFAQYDAKFRTEAVSPILNKVGQFLATATIRNIVGQPQSKLDIREIMDNKKIMIVNLSRGKIGEDNSALLGAMMITKIQLAAMSRADVTVSKRADSYVYVDEFQNFATESFAVILSEARKYNLNLTIANQYISQMPEEVRDAVFGNAGTIISFRVGGTDADHLVKEYEPVFEANDLVNLDKYNIYIKLLIDGISSPAFSARTLPPVDKITGLAETVINLSRKKYAKERALVEAAIEGTTTQELEDAVAEAKAFKEGGLEAVLTMKKKKGHDVSRVEEASNKLKNPKESDKKKNNPENEKQRERRSLKPIKNEEEKDNKPKVKEKDEERREKTPEEHGSKTNPSTKPQDDTETASDGKPKKKKVFKHENIIGDKIYKEQTARGGVKWYIGEKIEVKELEESGVEIDDEGKKMIEIAKKVGDSIKKKNKTSSSRSKNDEKKKSSTIKPKPTDKSKEEDKSISKDSSGGKKDDSNLKEGEVVSL